MLLCCCFCNNLEVNNSLDIFEEFGDSLAFAEFFNGFYGNKFAVNIDTECFESLRYLGVGNRAEDFTVFTCLDSDCESSHFKLLSQYLCVVAKFGELVSLLLEVLCKLFLCTLACYNSKFLGDKVVAAVTVFNLNDVVATSFLSKISIGQII